MLFFISKFSTSFDPALFPARPLFLYSILDLFLLELLLLILLGFLLLNRNIFSRTLLYLLSSIYLLIYFMQMASVHIGREFLSRLALENADHLYLFLDFKIIAFFFAIGSTCLLLIYLTEKGSPSRESSMGVIIIPFLAVGITVTLSSEFWLPPSIIKDRDHFLAANNLPHTSPVVALYKTLFRQNVSYSEPLLHKKLKAYELEELNKFGFHYDPTSEYPLIKPSIYSSPPPFPLSSTRTESTANVIVIFSEGLSARSIGAYGSIYPDLTPHIDEFARTGMVVHRYYNHTAATYRGLHGQLASIFPLFGGADGWHSDFNKVSGRSYLTLMDLFRNRGYDTIFLDSHHKTHPSKVDVMMTELGFGNVLTGEQLAADYLSDDPPLGQSAYSDQQYFKYVTGFLQQRLIDREDDKPFFLSLYNFGTHPFLKNSKDGVRYGKNKNATLNNIHNFDHAFGLFWNYLKNSPYFYNTIIILTADHCHYHEKTFVDVFEGQDYQQLFIDRIPLIIHDPHRELPESYDADNASSIDFAPTISHYLGLDNVKNPWLGGSIFERDSIHHSKKSVAALGPHEIFLITGDKIHSLDEDGEHQPTLQILDSYIAMVRQLELNNQIWDKDSPTFP